MPWFPANQSLSVVAANSGFVDQSHFSREFRRYFGMTPREYRKHYSRDMSGGQSEGSNDAGKVQ